MFIVFFQRVMRYRQNFESPTESGDTGMPFRRLKSTSANSCVPDRKPLGYVGYYAPAQVSSLCLVLHHFSIF